MFASFVGLLTIIVLVVLSFIRIPQLFGSGANGKAKGMLINMLAAKEVADIALKNNKESVPEMLSGLFSKNKNTGGGTTPNTDIEK